MQYIMMYICEDFRFFCFFEVYGLYNKYIDFNELTNQLISRFMVGGNGKVYEGAGWKVGAHTSGYNNRSISLSFIGDFRG